MKHNFGAGPSILPQVVFRKAAQAILNFNNTGLSILEISHRSSDFEEVMTQARDLPRQLLGLDDNWEVLYLTGGASSQFYMSVMNLLRDNEQAAYVDTGAWSKKAIIEATRLGRIDVVASSGDKNYTYIPRDYQIPTDSKYLHLTTNNTIFGTQYHELPEIDIPLVADMSSDIFSRPVDVERFGLIYCGAQKNLGPAGVTLVLLNKDFYHSAINDLPTMLDYNTHIEKGSMFNTPPVFPIYVSMLNLQWLSDQGGTSAMAERNAEKAHAIYREIETNPLFEGVVESRDRSHMNATFTLHREDLNADFLAFCAERDIVGLKGHRSVGGFRASMYNAMSLASVQALTTAMAEFANAHA